MATDSTAAAAPPRKRRAWGLTLLWLAPLLFMAAVVVYGVLTRTPTAGQDSGPQVGKPVPDFTLPDLAGRPVRLSALRGRVVLLNVWATWCPPCVDEMPTLQQLYDRLHGRGVEVLAVSIDALGEQVVAPFARQYRLTFPILLDPRGTIERLYRTTGVPESFIIDKEGRLVQKIVGPRDWAHPQMLALFERLAAAPSPASP
ncbi:MAG: thioredoxin [Candidatus Tectimicrobiota bacterium]|nr:MAG: thioredoxin [Candidatus Tectomicrobia bacterium]